MIAVGQRTATNPIPVCSDSPQRSPKYAKSSRCADHLRPAIWSTCIRTGADGEPADGKPPTFCGIFSSRSRSGNSRIFCRNTCRRFEKSGRFYPAARRKLVPLSGIFCRIGSHACDGLPQQMAGHRFTQNVFAAAGAKNRSPYLAHRHLGCCHPRNQRFDLGAATSTASSTHTADGRCDKAQ